MANIMNEDEYYGSDEHFESEESYSDYLKGKKKNRKKEDDMFGGVF